MIPNDDVSVTHNEREQRFESTVDGHLAATHYQRDGDRMIITHTVVPREVEGRGVGAALARTALAYAEEQELEVVPQCGFVAAYMRRHGMG